MLIPQSLQAQDPGRPSRLPGRLHTLGVSQWVKTLVQLGGADGCPADPTATPQPLELAGPVYPRLPWDPSHTAEAMCSWAPQLSASSSNMPTGTDLGLVAK